MPLNVIIALVFVGVFSILFFLLYMLIPGKTELEERVTGLKTKAEEWTFLEKPSSAFQKFLGRLGAGIPLRVQDYSKYTRMLIAAGFKKERLPAFFGSKIFLAVLLPAIYLLLYGIPIEKDMTMRVAFILIFAIIGFLLPSYWLSKKVKKRQTIIFHDLPDVLDLMTVSVEAGLSLEASMVRICEDPHFKNSPLIHEMNIALQETRAGKPRIEALRDMGERAMVDDLKSFAAMLIQTERLGTSLAQALRVHSDSLRTIRRQRAGGCCKDTDKASFPACILYIPGPAFCYSGACHYKNNQDVQRVLKGGETNESISGYSIAGCNSSRVGFNLY